MSPAERSAAVRSALDQLAERGLFGYPPAPVRPVMPCRECAGTGASPFNASLPCGLCDGTREDPSSPVWQVTS